MTELLEGKNEHRILLAQVRDLEGKIGHLAKDDMRAEDKKKWLEREIAQVRE